MIEALFDRLHQQAQVRADKEIKSHLAQLEKQKKEVMSGKDERVKYFLAAALKKLLADKIIEKGEAALMAKKYGLSLPKPPAPRVADTGGCGSMSSGHTGNRC